MDTNFSRQFLSLERSALVSSRRVMLVPHVCPGRWCFFLIEADAMTCCSSPLHDSCVTVHSIGKHCPEKARSRGSRDLQRLIWAFRCPLFSLLLVTEALHFFHARLRRIITPAPPSIFQHWAVGAAVCELSFPFGPCIDLLTLAAAGHPSPGHISLSC